MTPLHYSKAPIIEALVDFQIQRVPNETLAALKAIKLPSEYREVNILGEFTSEVRIEEQAPIASAKGGPIGYRFQSADDKYVLQARVNGFTFSRLAPYDRWEPFMEEARTVWQPYREVVGNVAVVQFSVRYINKLHMPPGSEMSVYLRTFPEVSPELPQTLHGSFMRLEMPLDLPDGMLILQQFYAPPEQPDQVAMILDNELRFQLSQGKLSDAELWARVEDLREVKNRVFRGCLTPKMEETIA